MSGLLGVPVYVGGKPRSLRLALAVVRAPARWDGFSYIEVLVAMSLITIALAPMLEALTDGLRSTAGHRTLVEDHYHVLGKVEEVLALSFAKLDAEAVAVASPTMPTAFSDTVGTPRRRLVYLARYDGDDADGDADPFTGGDDGLVWVRVKVEGTAHALETLTTR